MIPEHEKERGEVDRPGTFQGREQQRVGKRTKEGNRHIKESFRCFRTNPRTKFGCQFTNSKRGRTKPKTVNNNQTMEGTRKKSGWLEGGREVLGWKH